MQKRHSSGHGTFATVPLFARHVCSDGRKYQTLPDNKEAKNINSS